MSDASSRPLLVSFHRPLARHQILGVAKTVCPERESATAECLDYIHLAPRFDEENPEKTAGQILDKISAEYPGWEQRPFFYFSPGYVLAAQAMGDALLALTQQGLVAREVTLVPYSNEDGPASPPIYIAHEIKPPVGQTGKPEPVSRESLPPFVWLLDFGREVMPWVGEPGEKITELQESSKVLSWYPQGFRYAHVGRWPTGLDGAEGFSANQPFPEFAEEDPEAFAGRLGKWLRRHPAASEIDWGNEPMVVSWLDGKLYSFATALACIHGQIGHFPSYVYYKLPRGTTIWDYATCEPVLVDTQRLRHSYHPREVGFTQRDAPPRPAVVPRVGGGEPALVASAATWCVNRWPRKFRHVATAAPDDAGRTCRRIPDLPITGDGRTLGQSLPRGVAAHHSALCLRADAPDDESEREALALALWGYAYSIALGIKRQWYQSLTETLNEVAGALPGGLTASATVAGALAEVSLIIDKPKLQTCTNFAMQEAIAHQAPTRQPALVLHADVRGGETLVLNIVNNGAPPDKAAVDRIRNSPGEGTKTMLEFAADHLATLGLIWQDDSGRHYMQRFGGEWVSGDQGIRACKQPAVAWGEPQQWENDGDPWPVPKGYTTVWQFQIPLDIFRVEANMPLKPGDLSS